MSNQETRATTGRYAPSVHYSQHAPQPISQQLHTKPSNIKEPNWGETIASLADTAGKVYLKAREQDIKAEATKAVDSAKNDLARKANAIAEEQRQTGMSATTAASRYRMLADSALSGGMNEKDVADVIGRYDGGILNIDQSRQQKIMEDDQKYWENQAQEVADSNPALQRLQPSDRTRFLMEQRTLVDDVNNLRQTIGRMPEGPEKESVKTLLQGKIGSNVRANMVIQLGNMYAQAKVVTEEDWIALRSQGIDACMANGLDRATAGVIVDEIAKSYSVTGDLTDIKRYFKDDANFLESVNKTILAHAENRFLSAPGMALIQAAPQELQKLVLSRNWGVYQELTKPFLANVTTDKKTGKVTVEGLDRISPQLVGPLAQTVNNMNSSGMYNDYVRGKTTGIVLSKVNEINQLTPTSSASDASIVALNSDGTRKFINFNLTRKQVEGLKNSKDPEEVATGEWLEEQLNTAEEQEWLAKNIPTADKIVKTLTNLNGGDVEAYRANNSLRRSTNAASLRYDAEGNLFVSDADRGALANLGLALDASMPFGGEYKEELDTINNKLAALEPRMRKLVLARAGYKEAVEGELPLSVTSEMPKLADAEDIKEVWNRTKESQRNRIQTVVDGLMGRERTPARNLEDEKIQEGVEASRQAVKGYTGNIDILNRPEIQNANGTFSTLESASIYDDREGKHVLIPTIKVIDGVPERMSIEEAENWYYGTGEHLGMFDTPEEATAMGKKISNFKGKTKFGEARLSTSETLGFPHLSSSNEDPYAEGLTPDMIEEHNKQVDMVETETSVAGVIAQAVRESEPDSEEWNHWMDVLNRINKKLVEAGAEPIDPYEDRVR